MKRAIVALLALSLPLGCILHRPQSPTQTRIGPIESFGRGIVESEATWVTFDLDTAAYVIAVRITDPASVYRFRAYIPRQCLKRPTPRFRDFLRRGCGPALVDLIDPYAGQTRFFSAGAHSISVGGPFYRAGYWVVIASDAPTSVSQLLYAVMAPDRADSSFVYLANRIPAALIGNRTRHWVAYVAPFGDEDAPDVATGVPH